MITEMGGKHLESQQEAREVQQDVEQSVTNGPVISETAELQRERSRKQKGHRSVAGHVGF